jgi:tetratricopeptide (TPR) repeat protein
MKRRLICTLALVWFTAALLGCGGIAHPTPSPPLLPGAPSAAPIAGPRPSPSPTPVPGTLEFYIARAYELSGKPGEQLNVIAAYDAAIRLNPNLADAYLRRGYVYGDLRKFDEAVSDIMRYIELQPDTAYYGYYARGNIYLEQGKYDEAIADFDRTLQLRSTFPGVYGIRGSARMMQGDYERAIADCSRAVQEQPQPYDAYLTMGAAYWLRGDGRQAIASFEQAIKYAKTESHASPVRDLIAKASAPAFQMLDVAARRAAVGDAYAMRSIMLQSKEGSGADAINSARTAIQLAGEPVKAHVAHGLALDMYRMVSRTPGYRELAAQDYELVVAELTRRIAQDPTDGDAYRLRALLYERTARWANAAADRTIVATPGQTRGPLTPDDVDYGWRASVDTSLSTVTMHDTKDPIDAAFTAKDDDRVIADCTGLIDTFSRYDRWYRAYTTYALYMRGRAYREKGLTPQAITDLEQYLRRADSSASERKQVELWLGELKRQ